MNRTIADPDDDDQHEDNWLMEAIERACERSAQVPAWAKPVRIKK